MTARTKLNALDRLHTLLVLVVGSAVVITVLNLLEKPEQVIGQFAYMGVGLAAGFLTAYLVDVAIAASVRRLRDRLQAAVRNADPAA
ncbi:hypothetical protein ACGFNY_45420 [Streptomyces chartreusis]|uniref:hypothetical protein n=1 Tax=Streptomyces chartreusis TaxID=1969 RepID=UPI00371B2E59